MHRKVLGWGTALAIAFTGVAGAQNRCAPLLQGGVFNEMSTNTFSSYYNHARLFFCSSSNRSLENTRSLSGSGWAAMSGFLGQFGFQGDQASYERAIDTFCRNDDVLTAMQAQYAQSVRTASVALANAYVECTRTEQGFYYWATVNPDNPRIFSITARYTSPQQGAEIRFLSNIDVVPSDVSATCTNHNLFAQGARMRAPAEISMTCTRAQGVGVNVSISPNGTPANGPLTVPVLYTETVEEVIQEVISPVGLAEGVGPYETPGPQRCVSAPAGARLLVDGTMRLEVLVIWQNRDGQGRVGYDAPYEHPGQRDEQAFCGSLGTRPQCGAECRYHVEYQVRARARSVRLNRQPR